MTAVYAAASAFTDYIVMTMLGLNDVSTMVAANHIPNDFYGYSPFPFLFLVSTNLHVVSLEVIWALAAVLRRF